MVVQKLLAFFFIKIELIKRFKMDKEKKNRSGSQSNDNTKTGKSSDRGRTHLPGSPSKSNRQTGGNKRKERDDSSDGAEKNTTKKGPNSI